MHISNFIKANEDLKNFFNLYPQQDHEALVQILLQLGQKTVSQYSKLTIPGMRRLLNSSQVILKTEQYIEKLQENIMSLQTTLNTLHGVNFSSSEKSTNTEFSSKKPMKKVDFWNQTEEKENIPLSKPRVAWSKNTELNWVHDFSGEVKRLPKSKSPLLIRESRISILSKSKYSSIDEFF